MKTGTELIDDERARQIAKEGWTPEHDDEHDEGELSRAAACYATPTDHRRYYASADPMTDPPADWPWDPEWWKPKDRIRDLVRAGALIAAEIDRLQRLPHVEGRDR